jgi:hypothetical protein
MDAIALYGMSIKGFVRRIFSDLLSEIVVGASTLILFLTFLYVFNDFLNVQVASLSEAMRNRFAEVLSWGVMGLAGAFSGRSVRNERLSPTSIGSFAKFLGTPPSQTSFFRNLRYATLITIPQLIAVSFAIKFLLGTHYQYFGIQVGLMELIALTVIFWPTSNSEHSADQVNLDTSISSLRWHMTQLVYRSRISKVCFICSTVFLAAIALASWGAMPPFVAALAGFAGGCLLAFALAFQVGENLESAWIERSLGVSHTSYILTYEKASWILGTIFGALAFVVSLTFLYEVPNGVLASMKTGIVAALPAIFAPWLCFQIDARRPLISMMIIGIVSIFVCTAVIAHWLGLLLVPLLRHFALQSQEGRFYRA